MSDEHLPDSSREMAEDVSPIRSELSDDADMVQLVESFVTDLAARVTAIQDAATSGDADRLVTLAHQLKGAAGGYGFPSVSEVAWDLERALRYEGQDLADLRDQVANLLAVCRRVSR
jgi:HPt (histidine-containing phosphotransfer) domain-containing protein